jgi:Ser/Thr protein kinase RdoA (MazF antagonist)
MPDSSNIPQFLGQFWQIESPREVESLGGAGGFSGARFWRFSTPTAEFCLRRWPAEHPSAERLAWIHSILQLAGHEGIEFLPLPIQTLDGRTFAEHAGFRWELAHWLPGVADYHQHPTRAKLEAAFAALAKFHCAVASGPVVPAPDYPTLEVPPAIQARCDRLDELLAGRLQKVEQSIHSGDWPELATRAVRIVGFAKTWAKPCRQQLEPFHKTRVAIQPVIRDIWHDHVLFTGERVTGFVDFGAMRVDTVATDIARLCGSLVGDDLQQRHIALAAYESIRPLTHEEAALVTPLDQSSVLIGAMNWLDWIYCEHRQFENRQAVIARLDSMLVRMQAW